MSDDVKVQLLQSQSTLEQGQNGDTVSTGSGLGTGQDAIGLEAETDVASGAGY